MSKKIHILILKYFIAGTSLGVQWLKLRDPTAGGEVSIPGWGTKVLHTTGCSQKIGKNEQTLIEPLLSARQCSAHWEYSGDQIRFPAFMRILMLEGTRSMVNYYLMNTPLWSLLLRLGDETFHLFYLNPSIEPTLGFLGSQTWPPFIVLFF